MRTPVRIALERLVRRNEEYRQRRVIGLRADVIFSSCSSLYRKARNPGGVCATPSSSIVFLAVVLGIQVVQIIWPSGDSILRGY